jgi:uncharacterized pyridoxamine 5'-phosphate oxidase family protein
MFKTTAAALSAERNIIMEKVLEFLKEAGTWYIATVEGDQPRVRPFGAQMVYNGKLYITTNNTKKVYKQLLANPKFEISGMNKQGQWIRITGKAIPDDTVEAKQAMLDANPGLNSMYSLDDGIFAVLSVAEATAVIYSFTADPETISL